MIPRGRLEFRKPDFIGTHDVVKPREIDTPNFYQGKMTVVRSMDELPINVKDKIPDFRDNPGGFVVKQYYERKEDGSNVNTLSSKCGIDDVELFEDLERENKEPFPLSTHNPDNLSLSDYAYILKFRQDQLKRYFADKLPDLIVDSKFFIAANTNDDYGYRRFYLYEIQKRLIGFLNLKQLRVGLNTDWGGNREILENLIQQLTVFCELMNKMIGENDDQFFDERIPDFHLGNIAVMPDGNLRVFDTNVMYFKTYEKAVVMIKGMLQELESLILLLKDFLLKQDE
jgi:hypothetical protein